ncbi:MAG: hypothetical protein E3J90_01435 [Promethearchaeota archaeon]|nr:MAG: hypothetical protein E3J90_01435 [Candidatus Lokiarchaeota archaeon]
MRKKKIGIIYIIIGIYLLIFSPFLSLVFNQLNSSEDNLLTFLSLWFMETGWFVIMLALLGLYLIIIGNRYIVGFTTKSFYNTEQK